MVLISTNVDSGVPHPTQRTMVLNMTKRYLPRGESERTKGCNSSPWLKPGAFLHPLNPGVVKHLNVGWNAIGFSDTVPEAAANALRPVDGKWATLFGWNADGQEYDVSIIRGATGRHGERREMSPFQGYWLSMTDAGTLAAIGA